MHGVVEKLVINNAVTSYLISGISKVCYLLTFTLLPTP